MTKIAFYGRLADTLGPELEFAIPSGCSIAELRQQLSAEHPEAAEALASRRTRACVAGSLVRDDYAITRNDRIEFLPPVSGG
jgi:molybdopterin converting factor small subunit